MMKRFVVCSLSALFAVVGWADGSADAPKTKKTTGEVRKMLREQQQQRLIESGGLVIQKAEGKVLEVISRQKDVPESIIVESFDRVMRMTTIPIVYVKEKSANAGAWVELVCDMTSPSIVSAIDDGWARVNLYKVISDKPVEPKLRNRMQKYAWRAVGAALGIGATPFRPSIMGNIDRIEELDAIPLMQPEPPTMNCFKEIPAHFGIENIKIRSYRRACEEGWAPAPTNDIQKAIWEKVHAMPEHPIQIKPETKKVEK